MIRTPSLSLLSVIYLCIFYPPSLRAQTEPFSLPLHKGAMLLDLSGYQVKQSSAKPEGKELGLRVHDQDSMEALIFLFLTPEKAQTAASCRDAEIKELNRNGTIKRQDQPIEKDKVDFVTTLITHPNGHQNFYSFHGTGDQCLSISVYADRGTTLDLAKASSFLVRQSYDPQYSPKPKNKFIYANVLYHTGQYRASVPIYKSYLETDEGTKDLSMRRIATDNMGMALGMSGQVDDARKVFTDAIKTDSTYPLYYFNLACADAEQGNAKDAQFHLKQAFDRKANTLPGETLPDPTKDDSILKLRKDQAFWSFVQTLK